MTDAHRLLTIAAAGGHHLLLIGDSAVAPAMLARRLCSLLPQLDEGEALLLDDLRTGAGLHPLGPTPQLRAPHHTVSAQGLLGQVAARGRAEPTPPRVYPGEVALAHRGVLLLDEAPEFSRACTLGLADALHRGHVRHAARGYVGPGRVGEWVELPSRPLLVAAAWTCGGCDSRARSSGVCLCSPASVERYYARLDPLRPLLGLIIRGALDLGRSSAEAETVCAVARARGVQARRWGRGGEAVEGVTTNAEAVVAFPEPWRLAVRLACRGELALPGTDSVADRPARAHALAVARTIADLDFYDEVLQRHVDEAAALREQANARAGEG